MSVTKNYLRQTARSKTLAQQTSYSKYFTKGRKGLVDFTYGATEVISMRNVEASASIIFGAAVKLDDAANDGTSAAQPTATSETIAGILGFSHDYDNTGLNANEDGVLPEGNLNIIRRGRVLVPCENGCVRGNRLFVRVVISGNEERGALRSAADSTDCIDSRGQGYWDSSAGAGELAWLIVDFTRFPSDIDT